MKRRIPITIVSGFLGAGKTTILANLIRNSGESRLAVLINEFGAVSIDEQILKKQTSSKTAEFIKITNALVAYAGDDKFDQCMKLLGDRSDVDHVLIETSGLAVPTAVIERVSLPQFSEDFVLDAVLLVIDTPVLLNGVTNPLATVFKSQLECSDVVVLNKIDDLNEEDFLRAESIVRGCSPNVRFIELAYHGQIDKRVALGLRLNEATFGEISSRVTPLARAQVLRRDGHDHSGLGPHEHGLLTHQHIHEHDPGWISFVLRTDGLQDLAKLQETLKVISKSEPVFRIKGTVFVKGVREKLLYQAVGSRVAVEPFQQDSYSQPELVYSHRHIHGDTDDREYAHSHDQAHGHGHSHDHDHGYEEPNEEIQGELVFIGYHIDRERICSRLQEHTLTLWH